jgi:alpha-galactosidase
MMKLIQLVTLLLCALFAYVLSYNNGVAKTPPMGFAPWNTFRCEINETLYIETINTMASSGLRDLGYVYVNIDDCWSLKNRDPKTKRLVPDPKRFPSGVKYLSRYAHRKGMKMGIYNDVGEKTCMEYPGADGHFEIDAQTYADWEIDFLKFDYCFPIEEQKEKPWKDYTVMSKALNATGRPIVFAVCNWGVHEPWLWAPQISNMWRTTYDIEPNWNRIMYILDQNKKLYSYAGNHGWNDPDNLEVGVTIEGKTLLPQEARAHFSLWCMMSAPLFLGNDLRDASKIEPWVFEIIANRDAISIDQDPLGKQGMIAEEIIVGLEGDKCATDHCSRVEIWTKPLSDRRFAVLIFNRGGVDIIDAHFKPEYVNLDWARHLNMPRDTKYSIKNVWNKQECGIFSRVYSSDIIPVHDVMLLIMTPSG